MRHPRSTQWEESLQDRGEALAVGLGIILGDRLGTPLEPKVIAAEWRDAGDRPPELSAAGILVVHEGVLTGSNDPFRLVWFFPSEIADLTLQAKGEAGFDPLAGELAELLATDKYELTTSRHRRSSELWSDYVAAGPLDDAVWLGWTLEIPELAPLRLWLVWPAIVLERLYASEAAAADPVPPADPPDEEAATHQSTAPAEPAARLANSGPSLGTIRLMRTPVPLIVTLATKSLSIEKLLDLGPGTIIEFDKACDEPLNLSVNNLPIGRGEAVKIGDHFGLRLTEIATAEERATRLGEKWKY